jgi:hypothetical protein
VLDWTIALFFRPDITKVELAVEQVQVHLDSVSGVSASDRMSSRAA